MARNLENSTSENSNIQEMGPRRSTRLNVTISGTTPPLRGSTMATTVVATTATTRGEVHGTKATTQAMSFQAQGKPARAAQIQRKPNALPSSSPSLALTCATRRAAHSCGPACSRRAAHFRGPVCSLRAAHSRGPTCSRRAAHSRGPACFPQQPTSRQVACSRGPACSFGFPSSPSRPKTISTIRTYHRAGGIFTTLLCGFDISQFKSRARSLPHFHCLRRHILSKLFQSKWRTTLVSTSHRVDEHPCTTDDLDESALAAHRDATCP